MLKCVDVQESIYEFVDKEVDKKRAQKIRDHISSCDDCRGKKREAKKLLSLIRTAIKKHTDTDPSIQQLTGNRTTQEETVSSPS